MNSSAWLFIKNLFYTMSSNVLSLFISTLVILIVPKVIGVQSYGYWQLYMFYGSYAGFFMFGWSDGVYLRYGGKKYDKLNKELLFSQFWMLVISQVVFAILASGVTFLIIEDIDKQFVLLTVALGMVISGARVLLLNILQATNRIKEYARITMIDRLIYIVLIVFFILLGIKDYKLIIIADLIGKLVSLVNATRNCKEITLRDISDFYPNFTETYKNISVGIKLMFANIASMLIVGVVRFGIETSWDVSTFGKVSLTLSISNLMMVFINAVGIIMFPVLRRTDEHNLPKIYITFRDILMPLLLIILVMVYPLKIFLGIWLPEYIDTFKYMILVFPIFIYEGKMSLLINTFLKTLRKEKIMLKVNLISLLISIILTFITTIILNDLSLAMLSIVFILSFKCVLAELYLIKILDIKVYSDIGLELLLTLIFISTGWYLDSSTAVVIYLCAYIVYLFTKKDNLILSYTNIRSMLI